MVDDVATVRAFARTVTGRLGVFDEHWVGRGRPLGQSRLLFELRDGGLPLATLRTRLQLDSGYASRLVHALADDGLVTLADDDEDARSRSVALTPAGTAEVTTLDRLSQAHAAALVAPLDDDRRGRLVAAMAEVTRLLTAAAVTIEDVDPTTPAVTAAHRAYVDELAERFPAGFDPGDLTAEVHRYRPPSGACVVARLEGATIGTAALAPLAPSGPDDHAATPIGEVKRMWVAPTGRGLGVGRRLLETLHDRARAAGLRTLRLDTNETLGPAIELYGSAGYDRIERYNDNPYATHFFERAVDRD